MNSDYQQSSKQVTFAVDHRTRTFLYTLDAAGMVPDRSFKSIRAPVLWPQDEGYHVFELPPEWAHLLHEIRDPDVLLQFAQHKVSYRIVPKPSSPREVTVVDLPF
jgi:hypothetical protein